MRSQQGVVEGTWCESESVSEHAARDVHCVKSPAARAINVRSAGTIDQSFVAVGVACDGPRCTRTCASW